VRAALPRIVGTRPSDIDPALFTPYATGEISRLLMVVALTAERLPKRLLQVNAYPFLLSQLLEEAFPHAAVERTQAGFVGLTEIEHTLVDASGAAVRTLRSSLVDPERQPLPFADASFDTALMSGVLTWLSHDPALALTEVHRVLEAGGRLILSTVNVARADASRRLADGRGIDGALANAGRGAPQLRNYAAEELFDLLAGNGFAIERHLTRPLAPPERLDAAWYAAADDDGAGDIHYVVARPAERAEPYRPSWLYG
jgi:SAM-dependent methyltransferase